MAPPTRPTLFASPSRKEILEATSFQDTKSTLDRTIRRHHFNHAVDVFLPKRMPRDILKLISGVFSDTECEYYLVKHLSLSKLLDCDFIEAFVRTGRMSVLSHGTRIDTDNCVSLHHPGQLVLSLDKDSYEELGLQGKPFYPSGNKGPVQYTVCVDLLAKSFYPGRKLYDRALMIFEQRTWLTFDLLFCWVPHDDSLSRKSLYNYLRGWKSGDDIAVCTPQSECKYVEVRPPKIDFADLMGSEEPDVNCSFPEFVEWLGIIGCDIDCGDETIDPYISTYKCRNQIDQTTVITHAQWCGFFASDTFLQMVHRLRELVTSEMQWAAAVVHGYVDVPTTQQLGSDPCYPSAHIYVLVVFSDSRYWLCRGLPNEAKIKTEKKNVTETKLK